MGQLEESTELALDFTKLEKVGKQVSDTRCAGTAQCDPGVIPVAVQISRTDGGTPSCARSFKKERTFCCFSVIAAAFCSLRSFFLLDALM